MQKIIAQQSQFTNKLFIVYPQLIYRLKTKKTKTTKEKIHFSTKYYTLNNSN